MRRTTTVKDDRHRLALAVGAVTALLLVVAGAFLVVERDQQWTAEATLVVLPAAGLAPADEASYYETLSRGQVVATFAEVAKNRQFLQGGAGGVPLTPEAREGVSVDISVVPSTAVVLVRATAGSSATAESVADATATAAAAYFGGLQQPFRTDLVDAATGTAYLSSQSPGVLLAAVGLLALLAGFLARLAVLSWTTPENPARRARTTVLPSPVVNQHVNGASEVRGS